MSTIIYLYIKTHNKTGLKYLGKTTKKDQHKYKGSGKYWLKHIKKHGYDVTTEIIFQTIDKKEFEIVSEFFSNLFNIVESKEWANLCVENGKGTGLPGQKNGMFGRTHTQEVKNKLSAIAKKNFKNKTYEELYGLEKSQKLKKLRSENMKGKNCKGINNPRYDNRHYQLFNNKTKEIFVGTRHEFLLKYNYTKTGVHHLIHKKNVIYNNWILIS